MRFNVRSIPSILFFKNGRHVGHRGRRGPQAGARRKDQAAPYVRAHATLYVVATPLGNLADLSPRAADCLRQVAVVAAEDTRRTRGLLAPSEPTRSS